MSSNANRGAWIAYYTDGSGMRVFRSEIAALRCAINTSMAVVFVEWGQSLDEAAAAARDHHDAAEATEVVTADE